MKTLKCAVVLFLLSGIILTSCDEHKPPTIAFKTDAGYTSSDVTLAKGDPILVGITAKKTEDDMRTYNISVALNGSTTTTTVASFQLTGAEQQNYNKDYAFNAGAEAGTELYTFVITDKDGNIAKLSLTITVQ